MNAKGFTLIELIVGIVMLSLAAVMLMSYLDSGISQSGDPLLTLNDNYTVLRGIEIVNADYRGALEANSSQSISRYVGSDLSSTISELGSIGVSGKYVGFSNPDANRKVTETVSASSMYVKITATRNQSEMVTLLGN